MIMEFHSEMNKVMKTDKDYVIAIDTDSLYVNFGPLVDKLKPKDVVKTLDTICNDHFTKALNKAYHIIAKSEFTINLVIKLGLGSIKIKIINLDPKDRKLKKNIFFVKRAYNKGL